MDLHGIQHPWTSICGSAEPPDFGSILSSSTAGENWNDAFPWAHRGMSFGG
jgi:hypothetical protein